MVGRLVPVKRVDIFLRIAQAVLTQQRLKASPVFQVIGDGPLRQSLENLAADLGIAEQVSFVGHVDNAEQHIAELDVLVLCSDHEGLPMVALEAMKTCTAVLTHPIGGLPRLLDGGRCGYLVASQQPALFVDAIATMLSDRQDMVIRTELARQRLLDHYSSSAMARRHSELYQRLLQST
jgi:glycosyltransferase involved in cell wall biosynthesis